MLSFKRFPAALGTAVLLITLSSTPLRARSSSPYISNSSTAPDVYRVSFFLNEGTFPAGVDNTIVIMNPGTSGGNLCADIYVLDPSEELSECCSCKLTPDEIITGSVGPTLLANPANGVTLTNGVIKIISDSACNPGKPTPTPTLRAWITEIREINSVYYAEEDEFQFAPLSTAEESFLATACQDFINYYEGSGTCTCPTEPTL